MKKGYGSPYIKAFTSLGEITERIVDFSYKFSQKGDDVCQLRVESDDQNMPDYPIYQEGVEYTMVWGYIGETEKQKRLVVLRNIKASYTEEGVALDLLFTDKASLIKTNSSKRVYNKKNVKEVAEEVGARSGLKVSFHYETNFTPSFKNGAGFNTTPISTTAVNTKVPDNIRIFDTLPSANRSDHEVIKEAADNDPTGPYEVVGRDDTITVQKPNFNQPPIRTYKWKGEDGHLLKFTPESKEYFVGAGHLGIGITSINPKSKTAHETIVTEGNNGVTTKLGPTIATPNYDNDDDGSGNSDGTNDAATPTKSPTPVKSDPSIKGKELDTIAKNKGGDKTYNPKDELGFDDKKKDSFNGRHFSFTKYNNTTSSFVNKSGFNTAAISTTSVVKKVPEIPAFLTGQHTPTPEDDHKKASGKAASVQHKKSLEKNPATAKVVGNVILESGKLVTLENVSKKFGGNYYLQEVTHRMNPGNEYYCDLSMVRNAQGKVSKPAATTTDAANKYSKRGAKNEVNKEKGPEENKPKTKTLPEQPADQPLSVNTNTGLIL